LGWDRRTNREKEKKARRRARRGETEVGAKKMKNTSVSSGTETQRPHSALGVAGKPKEIMKNSQR